MSHKRQDKSRPKASLLLVISHGLTNIDIINLTTIVGWFVSLLVEHDLVEYVGDSIARFNVSSDKRGSIADIVFAALLKARYVVFALCTGIKSICHGNKIGWCAALQVR